MAKETKDVETQVLAMLCDDENPWHRGSNERGDTIIFNKDGTGTLIGGAQQMLYLAVQFKWSFNYESGGPTITDKGDFKFSIDMTLTPRPYEGYLQGKALQEYLQNPLSPSEAPFQWAPLRSTAFRTKKLSITLSRGRFIEPWHKYIKKPYPLFQSGLDRFAPCRYASQLLFTDIGPYPPYEEWDERDHRGQVEFHCWWEKKDFVRDEIARKDETWAEWLDWSWWLSPTKGQYYVDRVN